MIVGEIMENECVPWHISGDGSIIEEMITTFKNKNASMHIFTDSNDFYIFLDLDKCIVARGFLYVQNTSGDKLSIYIVNINKIEHIEIESSDKDVANT